MASSGHPESAYAGQLPIFPNASRSKGMCSGKVRRVVRQRRALAISHSGRGQSRQLKFAVAAGERRRRALLLLQQRGRLPKEHEVLCELVPPERALEVSLAENIGREAMYPADEFEAFKALF